MFHLYKYSTLSLQRNLPLSLRSLRANSELSGTEKTCLLCKHLNVNLRLQTRDQSSVTNPEVKKRKRTRRRRTKNTTDVFVVTDKFSGLQKAKIVKFTSEDLNVLTQSDFSLDELYKIRLLTHRNADKSSHTYSNLAIEGLSSVVNEVPEIIPNTPIAEPTTSDVITKSNIPVTKKTSKEQSKGVTETENDLEEDVVEDYEHNDVQFKSLGISSSFQPEVEEDDIVEASKSGVKEEETENVSKPYVEEHRNEIAARTLAAYIEVCNNLKNPKRGFQALQFHQVRVKRNSSRFSPMKQLNVYCALLKGFANKGDYQSLQRILDIMKEENISPDMQCYIAIFACLGKINVQDHYLKDIRIFVKDALRKGYTFDMIMNNGIFLNDERRMVLKVFKAFDDNYRPVYKKVNVHYKNRLLDHLNNEEQVNFKPPEWEENNGLFTPEFMNDRVAKQLKQEEDTYITIKSIENKNEPTAEVLQYRKTLENHFKMWRRDAEQAFQRDLATLAAKRSALNMEPYIRSIPSKDFIDIIIEEGKRMAQASETYSPEANILYRTLGWRVYGQYLMLLKQKSGVLEKILHIHLKYCEAYAAMHGQLDTLPENEQLVNPRTQWQSIEHDHRTFASGCTLDMGHQPWAPTSLTAIGKFMYNIIMHDLKIDVNSLRPQSKHKNLLPAFYTIFRNQGRMVKEEVKPHPVLSKLYKASEPETLTFPSTEIPMLCPPVPWTSINHGGYIVASTDVVRLPSQASSQKKRLAESDPVQLYPSLDALNQLASVPWKVNTKVLDVILKVFRDGGSAKLDVPEAPSKLPPPPPVRPDMTKPEKYQNIKLKMQYKRKKAEMYSLWCDCLYRLSLANHFKDDIFWLPHNMDFRGRVYPVPPHLNHLGSDLARSMLVFAESRPLGPEGLDWLKIHLVNLTGLKKRESVRDRLAYANDVMPLILDSADHPLDGRKWWAESDEPWQTLACCMEIADVVRSGIDPAEYRSHFPVHQDGSCNGLQHYAALGRDTAGAFSVNLSPCDVPQDVYSAVVALVEEQRAKDELDGIPIAKTLNGFIKRKVIKQTIMTTVYGVTRYGARLQIAKQLKDIDDFPKEAVFAASSYLTGRTFDSLRTMFTSTREIQDWFTECAKLVSGVVGKHLEWVTPLGLPIVQPYIHLKHIPSSGYDTFHMDQFEKPNVVKQKNAFPPNFIHSLDSSHMMLTSLHCERAGVTFVSVHDCYWTHPSTIHIMNKICREQFVALHSEPILEDLSISMYNNYSFEESELSDESSLADYQKKKLNKLLRTLPATGDFDINNVLDSVYFFS